MRIVALVISLAGAAFGEEPPPVKLIHERGAGAESCPDEVALRSATIERLGYDPFRDDAPRTLRTQIVVERGVFIGMLRLEGVGYQVLAEKRLLADACGELTEAMVLAIAIAVDPMAGLKPTHGPPVVSASPVAVSVARNVPRPAPAPADPVRWHVGLGGLAAAGAVPGTTVGALAEVGLSRRRWALGADVRTYVPAQVELQGGTVTIASYTATLVACTRLSRLSACALAVGGILRARGHDDLLEPRSSTTPRLGPGGRLSLDQPLGSRLTLRFQLDGGAWLTRTKLRVGSQEAWSVPAGFASLSVGLIATIP